jgi:hypothetical protein
MTPPTDDETPGHERARLREATLMILAVFFATRLVLLLVAAIVEFSLPLSNVTTTWDTRPILASFTGSDAVYYLGIAQDGYHLVPAKDNYQDWVFFPLFPAVVRGASILLLGDLTIAGLLVANLAFVGAMFGLYVLGLPHLGHTRSIRAVVLLAIAPGAVAFALPYSESLFLLFAIGACLAAERRRWGAMALLYCLASLARFPGVALAIPLVLLMAQSIGWRPSVSYLWLIVGPAATAGFLLFLAWFTGDALAYFHAQEAWRIPTMLDGPTSGSGSAASPLPLLLLATLVGYVFLFVFARVDRLPTAYVSIAVISVLTVFASGRLQSVARYLGVAWPFSWTLASRRSGWSILAWPIASSGLFTIHAFLHFTQALAP